MAAVNRVREPEAATGLPRAELDAVRERDDDPADALRGRDCDAEADAAFGCAPVAPAVVAPMPCPDEGSAIGPMLVRVVADAADVAAADAALLAPPELPPDAVVAG